MWNMKQKVINKLIRTNKNKLIAADNRMVITRRGGDKGEGKMGKGGQIYGN